MAPEDAKSIVVVGGGLAGMKTAAVAGSRGHRVVLLEREECLGGHLNLLMALPTRKEWGTAIDNLVRAMDVAGVDVRLGVDATLDVIEREMPDAVVVATGARWDCDGRSQFRPGSPSLAGTEQKNVIDVGTATARALADASALGQRVVILEETGFYLPLGLAEILAVERRRGGDRHAAVPMVGEDVMRTLDLSYVMPRLEEAGVLCSAHTNVEKIEGSTVHVRSVWGTRPRVIEGVDTVVISMLRSPNDALYRALEGSVAALHRVGDALAPRRPIQSMYEGEELGRAL